MFGELNLKMSKFLLRLDLGLPHRHRSAMFCLAAGGFSMLSPFEKLLQFCMSLLTFRSFVKRDGWCHESTEACDSQDSVPGIDTSLAVTASLLAWFALFPAIYTISKTVVPHGARLPERVRLHLPPSPTKSLALVPIDKIEDHLDLDHESKKSPPSRLRTGIEFIVHLMKYTSYISQIYGSS